MTYELGIHPALVDFMEAIEHGKKVVYHWSMNYLYCFATDFDPRNQYVSHWVYPGMHELLYPLYEREQGVVGVMFSCLPGLLRDTNLLHTKDKDNNLAAIEILECGVRWMEANDRSYQTMVGRNRETVLAENEMARSFLTKADILVPFEAWLLALPKTTA